jgi:hypothetical protein
MNDQILRRAEQSLANKNSSLDFYRRLCYNSQSIAAVHTVASRSACYHGTQQSFRSPGTLFERVFYTIAGSAGLAGRVDKKVRAGSAGEEAGFSHWNYLSYSRRIEKGCYGQEG